MTTVYDFTVKDRSGRDVSLDMINIGAYVPGSNPEIDLALEMNQPIRSFLQQSIDERCTLEQSFSLLDRLAGKATPAQPGS